MEKTIEIPEGYEARIEGNKVVLERKESKDEWIRKHIIKILVSLAPCHWDGNEKARCIAYLERQREGNLVDKKYVQEAFNKGMQAGMMQKPAEWSEEDEEMRASIVMTLAGFMGNEEKISWLKSLHPSWKPSEEQINILKRLCQLSDAMGERLEELESLSNNLKKS